LEEIAMKMSRTIVLAIAAFSTLLIATLVAQEGSTSNKPTTITGCLSGPNDEGAYVFRTAQGHAFEVGGNDQLKNHVGHEVKLTGNWVKSGADIGEKETGETSEKTESGTHRRVSEKHFKVSDIQHVSDSCSQSSTTGTKQ
jgi:hypothetical protein